LKPAFAASAKNINAVLFDRHVFSFPTFPYLHSSYEQKGFGEAEGLSLVDDSFCGLLSCLSIVRRFRQGFAACCLSRARGSYIRVVKIHEVLRLVRKNGQDQLTFWPEEQLPPLWIYYILEAVE
jgi:hypothetical protein